MLSLIHELTPLNRAICSRGYDRAVEILAAELPFTVKTVPQSVQHNGWVIPPSWDVEKATISLDGRIVFDGLTHPLGVISLSRCFSGAVDLEELKRHLHFDRRDPDAIPFHYRQQFRSWDRDWGFCVPERLYCSLSPGVYDVDIQTIESSGSVKILEYQHRGQSDYTIVLGANLDHAGVANDGLSGVAVGIELMRRLQAHTTKFTYALVLSPGIIGSELFLGLMDGRDRDKILEGVFLEMLGTDNSLALQAPRNQMTCVTAALQAALAEQKIPHRHGAFEEIIINDEYIWENYGIPMASFSRFPYPEYHSSKDNAALMRESSLIEAVEVVWGMIQHMERSPAVVRKFSGNLCLSNPSIDLYIDYGQIAFGEAPSEERRKMRSLMDFIPAIRKPVTVAAIAHAFQLRESLVLDYLRKWQAKGFVDLI